MLAPIEGGDLKLDSSVYVWASQDDLMEHSVKEDELSRCKS